MKNQIKPITKAELDNLKKEIEATFYAMLAQVKKKPTERNIRIMEKKFSAYYDQKVKNILFLTSDTHHENN